MSDLLDILAAQNIDTTVVHSVLPCFATACGLDFLTLTDAQRANGSDRAWVLGANGVTCPACLTAFGDLDGLRTEIRREQGHQAAVTP